MGAFHSTKIPVWNFGNSTCSMERYILVPPNRNDWIGQNRPLSGVVPNIPVGPNRSIWFLTKISEVFTEWKAPKVLKTIYSLHKGFPFCLFLYYFFHKIQNDTTKTCPCWQKSPVGQNLFRTSNLIGSCRPKALLFQSWGSFLVLFGLGPLFSKPFLWAVLRASGPQNHTVNSNIVLLTSRVMILLTSRKRLRIENSKTIDLPVNHRPRRKRFPKKS